MPERLVTLPVRITMRNCVRASPFASRGTAAPDWVRLNSRACGPFDLPRTFPQSSRESRRSSVSSQVTGVGVSSEGEFGANEWLVDELYEQFKVDKNSVDKAWWPILEAYHPVDTTATPPSAAPRAAHRGDSPAGTEPAPAAPQHLPPRHRSRGTPAPAAPSSRRRPQPTPRHRGAPGDGADPGHRRAAGRPHDRASRRAPADPGAGARRSPRRPSDREPRRRQGHRPARA